MMALLSLLAETWQSVHVLVSPRAADGVRHVGAEGDAAQALGRDRLLLHVDRLAVVVVRADVDGTRRAGRADAVAGDVAVAGQHVDVVAQRLEVVGDVVARHVAFVVQAAASSCWPSAADGSRKQLGFHDEWQAMQLMLLRCVGTRARSPLPGTSPQTICAVGARSAPSWPGAAFSL